jgi:polysaccharide biosynthesis protein PslJ
VIAQAPSRPATKSFPAYLPWEALLVAVLLTLMFIPARLYTLSSVLPFELEPYRAVLACVLVAWLGSALIDRRVRLRHTPFDGPIAVFVLVAAISLAANPGRAHSVASFVVKQLGFFAGVLLLVYFIASVAGGRVRSVELAAKVLVLAGVLLSLAGIIESRTGTNLFGSLDRIIPFLHSANVYAVSVSTDSRGADGRAFASSQHPIEFGAVLVMLLPLALALAGATKQRRWWIAVALLAPGTMAALSRTAVPMLFAAIVAGVWTRRREMIRLWPALIPLVVVIHFTVPGTMGSLAKSFFPQGGLIADQQTGVGSGRVATLGPVLRDEFTINPIVGVGFSTRVTTDGDPNLPRNAPILDNQWLDILLETGILGFVAMMWLFARVLRRCGAAAKLDYSRRGWLLSGMASSFAAFMIGMLTFDAFAFVQVTFLFAILLGLAAALLIRPQVDSGSPPTPDNQRGRRHQLATASGVVPQ